ncbi:MAG: DUF1549 domain-containing protein [Verrucomicrobiales bacterium]
MADRRTLVRRLSFDLTRLPPSCGGSPMRFARTNRRTPGNASPDRHARFSAIRRAGRGTARRGRNAETDGGARTLTQRDHAWRYRDYVVSAFNADKPVDAFIREQLVEATR